MVIIGHRGCHYQGYNQNTIKAFRKVLEQGCKAIEFDIQITADRELVIVHNLDLKEVSSGEGLVSETNFSDIRKLWAGDPTKSKDKIPTLTELLELHEMQEPAKKFQLHLELKGNDTGLPTAKMLRSWIDQQRIDPKYILVSTFHWEELHQLKKICPELKLALLTGAIYKPKLYSQLVLDFNTDPLEVKNIFKSIFSYSEENYMLPKKNKLDEALAILEQTIISSQQTRNTLQKVIKATFTGGNDLIKLFATAAELQVSAINPWAYALNPNLLRKAHTQAYKVFCYTVNDIPTMQKLVENQVDGFFTDDYSLAKQVISNTKHETR